MKMLKPIPNSTNLAHM